jgi:hypothetical protein
LKCYHIRKGGSITTQTKSLNDEGKSQLKEKLNGLPEANKDDVIKHIEDILNTPFLHPDGSPKEEWEMFYGNTLEAARDTASATADVTAMHVARDAAWDAAWDAARGAGRGAAWDAAMDAAQDAVREAAGNAVLDAPWDAALMAGYLVVGDLDFEGKDEYLKQALARWEVWQKGYGLFDNINGRLYVYARTPADLREEGKSQLMEKQVGIPEASKDKVIKFVLEDIPNTPFFRPDGSPKEEWRMFYGDTWGAALHEARDAVWRAGQRAGEDAHLDRAALHAAEEAARGAARRVALGAALGATEVTPGTARDAALKTALDAAGKAAMDAVHGAVRGAARDDTAIVWRAALRAAPGATLDVVRDDAAQEAARDAALVAGYLAVGDLDFKDKDKYSEHALARWEVWQKGYVLLGDIDGKLYVCAITPASLRKSEELEQRDRLIGAFQKDMPARYA